MQNIAHNIHPKITTDTQGHKQVLLDYDEYVQLMESCRTSSFMTSKEWVKEVLKNNPKKSKVSLLGCLADSSFDITDEDIAEARKEMWGKFGEKDI